MVEKGLCPSATHNPFARIALVAKVSFFLEIKKIATAGGAGYGAGTTGLRRL